MVTPAPCPLLHNKSWGQVTSVTGCSSGCWGLSAKVRTHMVTPWYPTLLVERGCQRQGSSQLSSHGARGCGDGAWRGLGWAAAPSPELGLHPLPMLRAVLGAEPSGAGVAEGGLRCCGSRWVSGGTGGAGGSCAAVPSACCQLSRCCGCLILSGGDRQGWGAGWGLEGLWGSVAGQGGQGQGPGLGQGSLLRPVWGRGCQGGGCCSSAGEPVRRGHQDMPKDTRRGKTCGSHRQRSCAWGQAGGEQPWPLLCPGALCPCPQACPARGVTLLAG